MLPMRFLAHPVSASNSGQAEQPLQLTHGFHFSFLTAAIYLTQSPQHSEVTESNFIPQADLLGDSRT